ncbi:MAG: hypothetical protein Kow0025_15940 [Thermodesulfovibrionales bacterium]
MDIDKRNKVWAFLIVGFLILISLLYYSVDTAYMYLITYIWFGVAYGLMLQYGRFCFASASRDLFAAGVPRMAVGILIALIFFSLIQAGLTATNMSTFHPAPRGMHVVVAGLIFGVGMVLAGGCASGSLYKIGEGNGTSILAILGISFGQAIFVDVGGVFNKLIPQSWTDAAMSRNIPAEKMTAWFDKYLVGYVWNKPAGEISQMDFIANNFSGASKYFVGNALLNAIIPAILLMVIIYAGYLRKGHLKKVAKEKGSTGFGDDIGGIWKMITASKRTSLMGVLIGITAGIHIYAMKGMQLRFGVQNFGQILTRMGHKGDVSLWGTVFDPGYWYITSQEAQFGAWFLDKIGWDMRDNMFFGVNNGLPELWRNPALWMSIGIIFGAMILALLSKEFKFKIPKGELIVWGLGGGLLMGLGSRLALGCNIGAFFIRVAGGDPGGWLFGLGMVGGAFLGVKFFNWWTERKMAKEMEDFDLALE